MKLNIFIKLSLFLVFVFVVASAAVWKFPQQALELGIWAERARNGLSRETLELDGAQWFYLEGGRGNAETVIMLHGFAGDKDHWTRFAGHLDDYHVIAVDLPGFGETDQLYDTSYMLAAQRERLYDFADALGIKRFHLLGSSMGGQIAAFFNAKYPEHVRSLGLISTAGITSPRPSEMQQRLAEGKPTPLIIEAQDEFVPMLDFVTYKRPWLPSLYRQHLAREAWLNASFHREIWSQLTVDPDRHLEPSLSQIDEPTWVLWGKEDRVLDVSSIEVITPLLRNGQTVVLEKTGHLPMLERPAVTAAHYLEFLQSLPSD